MAKRWNGFFFASLCAALIVACSGGGGAPSLGTPVGSGSQPSTYAFTISVPPPSVASASQRKAAYFSPSTQSLRIDVNYVNSSSSPTTVVAGLAAGASNCSPSEGGGLTCTVNVIVQNGALSFTLTTFDGPNATGHSLSTATVAVPAPSGAVTPVNVTMSGIIAALRLAFLGGTPTLGQAGTFTLIITGLDADGNVIVPPGNYASSISLSSDSNVLSLTPSVVTAPGTQITVSYNGATVPAAHIVAATAGLSGTVQVIVSLPVFGGTAAPTPTPVSSASPTPVSSASPTPTLTPTPTPTPPLGPFLYVANHGTNTVLKFTLPLTAGSSALTQTTVPGSGVNGVAVNAQFIATLSTAGQAALFAQPLGSTSTPTVQFTVPQLTGALTAFDGSGDLWTATANDTFDEYKPPFSNGMSPALNTDNISAGVGIVFDASANLYMTDGTSLDVFAPPYTGTPISIILPAPIGAGGVTAIGDAIIGSQIFIADSFHNTILVYNLPITLSSTPAVKFAAAGPQGLAGDSLGNLYVASSTSAIFVFAPPFTASSVPALTALKGISGPVGIAVGP